MYVVHLTNFGYSSGQTYENLLQAQKAAERYGFEASIRFKHPDGTEEIVAARSAFGDWRYYGDHRLAQIYRQSAEFREEHRHSFLNEAGVIEARKEGFAYTPWAPSS